MKPANHSLKPLASNQWYSSIYHSFPTEPLFAFPLAYKLSQQGVSFSYPDVVKTPNTIFGSFNSDLTVGGESPFDKPQIQSLGDWNINVRMQNSEGAISFFMTQGIPFSVIHSTMKDFVISFADAPKSLSPTKNVDYFIVSVKNHTYILVFPTRTSINIANNTLRLKGQTKLLVGLLDKLEHSSLFRQQLNNDVVGTVATPFIINNSLETNYTINTTSGETLIVLLPHQYKNLNSSETHVGSYASLRGQLRLIKTSSFTTKIPLVVPPDTFSPLSNPDEKLILQLHNDVNDYVAKGMPNSTDYYLGTWLGKGTSLLQLADTLGQDEDKKKLIPYLSQIFLKSLKNFTYNTTSTSVVAKNPEFGNENNNDHHFHYGYFIRTAAVLAKYDPSLLRKMKPKVDLLVNDIANYDKKSQKYPYLRNFDVYESHSWADGFADFADGNNQESSSEAINAWYAVYLWGKVTQNADIEKYALYLYNSEILGAKNYWFNDANIFSLPYNHKIGSIVWGGKVDFATWFSNQANMKYGIEILPITPASRYLGTLQDFDGYEKDFLSSGGSLSESWGDLFLVFKSFYKPKEAFDQANQVKKFEDNDPKSLFMYMIEHNREQK